MKVIKTAIKLIAFEAFSELYHNEYYIYDKFSSDVLFIEMCIEEYTTDKFNNKDEI